MSATFETLTTTYENITPEIAKEYLGRNSKNRVVKPKSVEAYARDMQHGDFKTIHQGIAFDTEGNLIDGQHRLLAIILSNTPVTMMVTRGVPVDDGIIVTDRGVSRSVRDVMAIENKNCRIFENFKSSITNILGTQNAIYHFVNNTGVSRIVAPAEPRYDIREKMEHALCVS